MHCFIVDGLTSTELLYFWKENNPVVVENFNLPLYHVDDKPKTSRRTCHNSIFEESNYFERTFKTFILLHAIRQSKWSPLIEIATVSLTNCSDLNHF